MIRPEITKFMLFHFILHPFSASNAWDFLKNGTELPVSKKDSDILRVGPGKPGAIQ
jgi:hypothetical protein